MAPSTTSRRVHLNRLGGRTLWLADFLVGPALTLMAGIVEPPSLMCKRTRPDIWMNTVAWQKRADDLPYLRNRRQRCSVSRQQ
jgi:hypothetical protein